MTLAMSCPSLGSPAWAGIDRRREEHKRNVEGFPRVGGDRPFIMDGDALPVEVPPRGRG